MFYLLGAVREQSTEVLEYIQELTRSITRYIVLVVMIFGLFTMYLFGAVNPARHMLNIYIITPLVVLTMWLTLRLLNKQHLLAQIILQGGMLINITLAFALFQFREIGFMYILPPLVAAIVGGWPFALIVTGVVIALLFALRLYPAFFPFYSTDWLVILIAAVLVSLLAAIVTSAMLEMVKRSFRESKQARDQMEAFQKQRLELFQTHEDLLHANNELARLSERLKVMMDVAEDARRVKEEFVANVSHELRTPLNMIIGFSELISKSPRTYGKLPPTLLADIAAIQRNSQHLSELVDDVLDLSQIEAGKMSLSKDWAELHELIESAVSASRVFFEMKGLYLTCDLLEEPLNIFCDRTRIREVILNLLSNAGRFTETGGVCVSAAIDQDMLVVSVADTGPGIPSDQQARLFEPFQQLDNSIRKQGGTGLGLSISRRFIELHGGKMWLDSQVGVGTTFYFSIPLPIIRPFGGGVSGAKRWITPYHQPDKDFHASKAPLPEVNPRFVLYDASDALNRMIGRYAEGIELISTSSLNAALDELRRTPCQGLIINAATVDPLEDISGAMRDLPFMTPVITCWITGSADIARKLGVIQYLVKPVSREQLFEALDGLGREIETILLVDDQAEVLQLFGRMLNSGNKSYTVLRAKDGNQALEILRERRPDVVLMDLIMPELDGFAVLEEKNMDEAIRDIPVVVVSSKDPTSAPIVSDSLNIARIGGLSARELLLCTRAISDILAPASPLITISQR